MDTETCIEGDNVKTTSRENMETEAEIGEMGLQAKEHQGLPATPGTRERP